MHLPKSRRRLLYPPGLCFYHSQKSLAPCGLKFEKKFDLEKPQLIKPRFFDFFIMHFFFSPLFSFTRRTIYDNLFFILGKTKSYMYMCHAGKHKVPKSQRWRCCTYTKQVLPNNRESNQSYIERKKENFCLFDLTFFVQNVIFQRFRICGFR